MAKPGRKRLNHGLNKQHSKRPLRGPLKTGNLTQRSPITLTEDSRAYLTQYKLSYHDGAADIMLRMVARYKYLMFINPLKVSKQELIVCAQCCRDLMPLRAADLRILPAIITDAPWYGKTCQANAVLPADLLRKLHQYSFLDLCHLSDHIEKIAHEQYVLSELKKNEAKVQGRQWPDIKTDRLDFDWIGRNRQQYEDAVLNQS